MIPLARFASARHGHRTIFSSSSLLGVMAQRLVRRVCQDCRQPYQPEEQEIREIGLGPEAVADR